YLAALASVCTTYFISTKGKTALWRVLAGAAGAAFFVVMAVFSLKAVVIVGQTLSFDWSIVTAAVIASAAVTGAGAWRNNNRGLLQLTIAAALAATGVLLA